MQTIHYGKYQIDTVLNTGVLTPLLSILATIIGKAVAELLGFLLAILALLFVSVYLFTLLIVEAEMGDGWAYAKVQGTTWYISFGLWRDWWW